MKRVVVFVSVPEAGEVRNAIIQSGAGRLGNYSATLNHVHTGTANSLRAIDEERIEFACDDATFVAIASAIGGVSPYTSVESWNTDNLAR